MKKVGIFMYRMYRIYDFSDLKDEVFGYLSEFAASIGEPYVERYLTETDIESGITEAIRAVIQGHEYHEQVDYFDNCESVFLTVKTSRDDFSTIETDEDGTMSIGVQLDFRVVDEDIEDVDCDARYNFKVLIKGVK
jgi:hypothetical protein